ncbi:hypothetical protein WMF18_02565 [Sorangium sp. So ce315]|uniref:hypothetical protein n=1 Tax=Sorangium sp. So ce315 TaxID=3133299 RepID=UPI003F5E88CD
MINARSSLAVVAGSLLFASGCVAAPQGGAEDELAVAEDAIIWTNGDGPSFFWQTTTQQLLQRLAMSPLVDRSTGLLTETRLLRSAEGRELLHYVVGCALDPRTKVSTSLPGVSFEGAIGLATTWRTAKLGALSSQRWVTACLLQTLNGIGAHVPIRMVGNHKGLVGASAKDAVDFSIPDATMFGNVFDPAKVEVFACADTGAAKACGFSWSAFAHLRICDSSPLCGITLLGPCQDEAVTHCWTDSAGERVCGTPGGTVYTEAISTFLDAAGFVALYPSCGPRPRR